MHSLTLGTGVGKSLAMCIKYQQEQKRLRGITTAVAVAYYSAVNSGPASKTSSSLAFPNFFSMRDGILATEGLIWAQILASLDSSLLLVPCFAVYLSPQAVSQLEMVLRSPPSLLALVTSKHQTNLQELFCPFCSCICNSSSQHRIYPYLQTSPTAKCSHL